MKKGDRKQRVSFKNTSGVSDDFQRVARLQDQGDGLSRRNTVLRAGTPLDFAVDDQIKYDGSIFPRVGSREIM